MMLPLVAVIISLVVGVSSDSEGVIFNINTGQCPGDGGQSLNPHPLIAFSVGRKTDFVPSTTSRVPMDVTFYNDGNHFTSSNVFLVPVCGLYSFYFGASGDAGKNTYLILKAGNPEKEVAKSYDYGARFGAAGANVLLKLKKDETVSMWMHQGNNNYGLDGNSVPTIYFNGFLIKQLPC